MSDGDVSLTFTLPDLPVEKVFIEIDTTDSPRAESSQGRDRSQADFDAQPQRRVRDRSTTKGGNA